MSAAPITFVGKSYPMTVITPVSPWKRMLLKGILWVFTHLSFDVVKQLAFIHFARWILIRRDKLPCLDPRQPQENLPDDLYLFATNFNGSWDQYIDAFGMIHEVSKGLNLLWCTSNGFPGPWPMTRFKRYIRYFEYPLDLYYNAYPGATVRDIEAATQLEPSLDAFIKATENELDDAEFAAHYQSLLNAASPYLGTVGMDTDPLPRHHHGEPIGLNP